MKEALQMLLDAFPGLRHHPRLILVGFVILSVLAALYRARDLRSRICRPLLTKLSDRISVTSCSLFVHQGSRKEEDWKYYTSEITGKGRPGDDVVWTLVRWPSLKPEDFFTVAGGFKAVNGPHDSQAKLLARWSIVHDLDSPGIGRVPARGIRSKLRRASVKFLMWVG